MKYTIKDYQEYFGDQSAVDLLSGMMTGIQLREYVEKMCIELGIKMNTDTMSDLRKGVEIVMYLASNDKVTLDRNIHITGIPLHDIHVTIVKLCDTITLEDLKDLKLTVTSTIKLYPIMLNKVIQGD